ncbi:MAG: hypothetical protein NXH87_09310 [Rhodobiaceae bacterium]|nr:hypothetical protein [Rhodobiaceae bacterium]
MSTAKVRIDQSSGVIEVEGPVDFVKEVYNDFKEQKLTTPNASKPKNTAGNGAKKKTSAASSKKNNKKSSSEGTLDKNLDLAGSSEAPSLKDYLAGFDAKSNVKKNVVFVSYLKDVLGIDKVNIDHIYTCFDDTGKIPSPLTQSLYDASGTARGGYINLPSLDDISLSVKGRNWLKDNKVTAKN